jgi:hypothetical protein
METLKQCTRCCAELEISCFGPCKSTKDNLNVWCRECCRAYGRENYKNNADKYNARRRDLWKNKGI